jgi:hypothetical protein
MKYKPNWMEAEERWGRLWRGESLERPILCLTAPLDSGVSAPVPADDEERWVGKEFILESFRSRLSSTWWGGESIPSFLLMSGWIVAYGGKPIFAPDTIWYEHRSYDFDAAPCLRLDPEDAWTKRFIDVYCALAEQAGRNAFMVGAPTLLPANDILAMQMGTDSFLVALIDQPEWMAEAIVMGGRAQIEARRHIQGLIKNKHDFWYGNAGWMRFWAPEEFVAIQSDVSCMVSPEMFDRFILPELVAYGADAGALWYHLDGGNAKQHLPSLLGIESLRVVQYVASPCEPRNGIEHLDLYKTIQDSGRIVHIGVPKNKIEELCRCPALDPSRLVIETTVESPAEGEDLLAAAKRWCTSRSRR